MRNSRRYIAAMRPSAPRSRRAAAFIVGCLLLLHSAAADAWPSAVASQFGEHAKAVATDKGGNTYVAGTFDGVLSPSNHTVTSNGQGDVFVAKLNPVGAVVWIASAGSDRDDDVGGIGVDSGGNVYVAGTFFKTIFFTADEDVATPLDLKLTATPGEFLQNDQNIQTCSVNIPATDAFVAKLDKDGKWLWAAQAGGKGFDKGNDLAVQANAVYVTGSYGYTLKFQDIGGAPSTVADLPLPTERPAESFGWDGPICRDLTGCPPSEADFDPECQKRSDMFVARIGFDGKWTWAVRGGATVPSRSGDAIAVDAGRNIYVAGTRVLGASTFDTSFLARIKDDGTSGSVAYNVADLKFAATDVATDGFQHVIVGGTAKQSVTVGTTSVDGTEQAPAPVIARFTDMGSGTGLAGQWVEGASLFNFDLGCLSCSFGGEVAGTGVAFDDNGNAYLAGKFGPANVALVSDFETAGPLPAYSPHNNGDTVDGWTVGKGGIGGIIVSGTLLRAASGRRAIVLAGNFLSGSQLIHRTVPTGPGEQYLIRFALAGNPLEPSSKTLRVSWNSVPVPANKCRTLQPSQRVTFDGDLIVFNGAGLSVQDPGWEDVECQVDAPFQLETDLQFEGGPTATAIDNIRVIAPNTLLPGGSLSFGPPQDNISLLPLSNLGSTDIFVASLNPDGDWRWAKRAGSADGTEGAVAIADAADGELVTVGDFTATASFENPPPNESGDLVAAGGTDAFAARITDAGQWVAVQKWVVGQEVPRPAGACGPDNPKCPMPRQPVVEVEGGDPSSDALFLWSAFDKKLYAIGPATATVRWFDDAAQQAPTKSTTGTADFPGIGGRSGRTQTHVATAPVDLELNAAVQHCGPGGDHPFYACRDEQNNPTPECGTSPACAPLGNDNRYSLIVREGDKPSFTDNDARIHVDNQKKVFDAPRPGHSVLVYVNGPTADPAQGTVKIDVVRTVLPRGRCQGSGELAGKSCVFDTDCGDAAPCGMATDSSCTIGTPLVDPAHRDPNRRNGWVFNPGSRYDGAGVDRAHDRATRSGPIIPVNEDSPTDSSDDMVVAWYHENDRGIAWPEVATRYACAWPTDADKIVIASGRGSDVGRCAGATPKRGTACRDASDCTAGEPSFCCGPDGCDRVRSGLPIVGGPTLGFCSSGSDVPCSTDDDCVATCNLQPALDPAAFPQARIYNQPDREDAAGAKLPGFNPNEEHALLAPSSTGRSGPAVFALRNDLGDPLGSDINALSEPYVLLKYRDPQSDDWRIKVYAVLAEDGPFTFQYTVEAGQQIEPPYPLSILPACSESCAPNVADCGGTTNAVCALSTHKLCQGGDRAGVRCDVDAECPDGTCIAESGDRCLGGPRHGEKCDADADCRGGPICGASAGSSTKQCVGGSLDGTACKKDADCQSECTSMCGASTSDNLPLFKDYRALGSDGTWTGWWARAAGTVQTQYYYPLQPGFYSKNLDLNHDKVENDPPGTCVPWLDTYAKAKGSPVNQDGFPPPVTVTYASHWPATPPQLDVGQTLLRPTTCDDPTGGGCLPNIADQAAAQVIFEQRNEAPTTQNDRGDLVRMFNPLAERAVFLRQIPDDLTIDHDGARTVITGNLTGVKIPFALRTRLSFEPGPFSICDGGVGDALGCVRTDLKACAADPALAIAQGTCKVGGRLRFRGVFDDRNLGEPLLLPNILTDAEWEFLRGLSTDTGFQTAVDNLYRKTRNPNLVHRDGTPMCHHSEISGTCPLEVGFVPDMAGTAKPENVLETKALSAGDPRSQGFVTVIFNNDSHLSPAPVTAKVIRVGCGPYQGQIQVIQPDNVFDEQLTLRHNGDFGGDPSRLNFEWYYALKDKDCKSISALPFPSGQPAGDGQPEYPWLRLAGGNGVVQVTLQGPQLTTLADTCIFTRYTGYGLCENTTTPSQWAGAPLPNNQPASQLAPGWLARVARGLNPFDARTNDFRQSAVNTFASMIAQAGTRYEGDIAFNGSADNLNGIGLIEAYETVLRRGLDLSINQGLNVDAVNNKLLDVTSRIAGLYMLLGNEAFSDAQDPTVGFDTSGEFGSLAPSIFAFEDQLDSPLTEELSLLRGRDDGSGPAPVYNRLIWNFTGGTGQVAYKQNYNITDQNNDGFINEFDAKLLFPQGHGDAWGHYLSALTTYYRLLRNKGKDPNDPADDFHWIPRSDSVLVAGSEVLVDFTDERKFADAAAARARTGAQIVDLTYRQRWVDDPSGQWQGYKDTDPNRAFGVSEWAARAGQGAYFDWVVANAILPPASDKPPGIEKIDRTTVPELNEIVSQFNDVQAKLDEADAGLNPVGLAKNVVPFDIDPTFLDTGSTTSVGTRAIQGLSHFEQIYERALGSFQNAVRVFDNANSLTALLRSNQDTVDDFRRNTVDSERDYNNRLIEIFGSPYPEDIGPGKTYPSGYTGPDLWNYDIVEQSELTGGDPGQTEGVLTCTSGPYAGLPCSTDTECCTSSDCPADEHRCQPGGDFTQFELPSIVHKTLDCSGADAKNATDVTNTCRLDPGSGRFDYDEDGTPKTVRGTLAIRLSNAGFGRVKDPSWTRRASPGELQMAHSDLIQALGEFRRAVAAHKAAVNQIECDLSSIKGQNNQAEAEVAVLEQKRDTKIGLGAAITAAKANEVAMARIADLIEKRKEDFVKGLPIIAGLDVDPSAAARGAIGFIGSTAYGIAGYAADASQGVQTILQNAQDAQDDVADVKTARLDQQNAQFTQLGAIGQDVTEQYAALDEALTAAEAVRQAQAKVDATLASGLRLYDELIAFRKKTAAQVADLRYNDMAFRIFRNDALQKYKAQFDLTTRYVYLAASAYDYETNLVGTEPNSGRQFLTDVVRQRSLGQVVDGQPVVGSHGLADTMGRMRANFDVIDSQLGFNRPDTETNRFSLRRELFRVLAPESLCASGDDACLQDPSNIALLASSDAKWREMLEHHRVDNLWSVNEFRRFARPFAPENAGPQPGIVIPFDTNVISGLNFFGWPLSGGDSAYDPSKFSTKVRSVGVWFSNYNGRDLSNTPRVYLIPVGADVLRPVSAFDFTPRQFLVFDQKIPVPFPIGSTDLTDPAWSPMLNTLGGSPTEIRRYDALRAYHDSGFSQDEVTYSSRAVGRSVWNTRWVLIIPGGTLLNDAEEGVNRMIYGKPMAGGPVTDKNGVARDGAGISDIRMFFQTYAYSGN